MGKRKMVRELSKLQRDHARGLRLLAPQIPYETAMRIVDQHMTRLIESRDFDLSMAAMNPELPQLERQRVVALYQKVSDIVFRHTGERISVPNGDAFQMDV
jgi:hypothetical protein